MILHQIMTRKISPFSQNSVQRASPEPASKIVQNMDATPEKSATNSNYGQNTAERKARYDKVLEENKRLIDTVKARKRLNESSSRLNSSYISSIAPNTPAHKEMDLPSQQISSQEVSPIGKVGQVQDAMSNGTLSMVQALETPHGKAQTPTLPPAKNDAKTTEGNQNILNQKSNANHHFHEGAGTPSRLRESQMSSLPSTSPSKVEEILGAEGLLELHSYDAGLTPKSNLNNFNSTKNQNVNNEAQSDAPESEGSFPIPEWGPNGSPTKNHDWGAVPDVQKPVSSYFFERTKNVFKF